MNKADSRKRRAAPPPTTRALRLSAEIALSLAVLAGVLTHCMAAGQSHQGVYCDYSLDGESCLPTAGMLLLLVVNAGAVFAAAFLFLALILVLPEALLAASERRAVARSAVDEKLVKPRPKS